MKRIVLTLVLAALAMAAGQQPTDQTQVMETLERYVSRDLDEKASTLLDEVCCMIPFTPPGLGRPLVLKSGRSEILATGILPQRPFPALDNAKVHVIKGNMAAATVTTDQFVEEVLLNRIDGQWRIVNLLHKNARFPKTGVRETDKAGIEAACRDYIEGAFSGSRERMTRALATTFNKVIIRPLPGGKGAVVNYSPYQMMLDFTEAGAGNLPEEKWDISFRILHQHDDIAMAEVLSSQYWDCVQLHRFGDQWKIINVLWEANPAARPRH